MRRRSHSSPPLAEAEETAASLAARIRRREISALEAVSTALARIDALDGALHAFCTRCDDVALAQAAALDRRLSAGDPVGPLAGVPVAVKDLIDTKGLRTTYGSPLYADHVPEEDDVVVERLVAAGAIVVGKTNTSEFGYGAVGVNPLFPATRNPWNLSLTSGGSSAGTAAAVASGMVPFGLGSDGGGSVRIPASLCGIVGVKPSFGRTPLYPGCRDPRFPGASGWESLEHIGPLARTVEDAALALSVITGPSPKDRHSLPAEISDWQVPPPETMRGLRIAFSPDLGFAAIDPEARTIAEAAARRFEHDLGAIVEFAHPKVGDTQTAFQALVALDTDRNGLRGLARDAGHRLRRPAQRASRDPMDGRRLHRRDSGPQDDRQRHVAVHEALRFPHDAGDRRRRLSGGMGRSALHRWATGRTKRLDAVLGNRKSHRAACRFRPGGMDARGAAGGLADRRAAARRSWRAGGLRRPRSRPALDVAAAEHVTEPAS